MAVLEQLGADPGVLQAPGHAEQLLLLPLDVVAPALGNLDNVYSRYLSIISPELLAPVGVEQPGLGLDPLHLDGLPAPQQQGEGHREQEAVHLVCVF